MRMFEVGGTILISLALGACSSAGGGGSGFGADGGGVGGSVSSTGGAWGFGGAGAGGAAAGGGTPSFGGAPSGGSSFGGSSFGGSSFGGSSFGGSSFGGSSFGGSGATTGGSGGIDTTNCTGPASSTGSLPGATPNVTVGFVQPDPAGNLKVILAPKVTTSQGDIVLGVYFFPTPGQLSYPSNGSVGCVVFRDDGSSYTVVDKTTMCDLELTGLVLASSPGVCDGMISGSFTALFSGNTPVGGAFTLPVKVAESQTSHPSCQPMDGPCSLDSDCCSASCSKFIGVCN